LDLLVTDGTSVYWTGNVKGVVVYNGDSAPPYQDAKPNVVVEAGGYYVVFGHLSTWTVQENQQVTSGTQLGTTGAGHLHLGVVKGAKYYNPLYFFDQSIVNTFVASMGTYWGDESPWSMKSYTRSTGKCDKYFWGCTPDRTGIDR
jgi:murein DD-endopeptidase MepM/ murein hydrolase activator NlpD